MGRETSLLNNMPVSSVWILAVQGTCYLGGWCVKIWIVDLWMTGIGLIGEGIEACNNDYLLSKFYST